MHLGFRRFTSDVPPPRRPWHGIGLRSVSWLLSAVLVGALWYGAAPVTAIFAQPPAETLDESATTPTTPATSVAKPKDPAPSLFQMLFTGGPLGIFITFCILLTSVLAVAFIVEHSMTIRRSTIMPDRVTAELEQLVAQGKVKDAIEYCQMPENYSLVSNCVLSGLERFQSSDFGFAEYRSAVEEEGENQTARLYRKTEMLGVLGAIAPMLGLLGTVWGMILAFNTIASEEGMAKPEQLADGIGQALITTLLGLMVAIPSMLAFSFFRNRIDSLVAEAGKRIEHIMLPLGRQKK
jgi:biopolymer transport protein ExbB